MPLAVLVHALDADEASLPPPDRQRPMRHHRCDYCGTWDCHGQCLHEHEALSDVDDDTPPARQLDPAELAIDPAYTE